MEPKINYVFLLLLIILGVALGNLASSWFAAKYIDNNIEKAHTGTPKVLVEDASKPTPTQEADTSPEVKAPTRTETIRETVKLSPENQTNPKTVAPLPNTKELLEQRKLDEIGVKLGKKCNEWTIVHKDMNTETSERGMNKHCSDYYDYLSFGNLPDSS